MAHTVITAKTYVFDANGDLLVLKRHDGSKHRPGGPDLPGGHVEIDENYTQAAVREAVEETGLELNPDNIHIFFTNSVVVDGHNIISFLLSTKLDVVRPAITLSWEHPSYEWVKPKDIDAALHDSPRMLLAYHYGLNNHLL